MDNWNDFTLSPQQARLAQSGISERKTRRRLRPFIKGPIPLEWVRAAVRCGPPAAAVAWLLWYLHGLTRERRFTVSNIKAKALGISRGTKMRGLHALAEAGLISFDRARKQSPRVTMLRAED